jgi:enamine deaminase RidA (YjgF/YER057c/UK114 family)
MTIQRFDTGPRMSQAVVHGNTVYLAGVVADDTKLDTAGQTRQVLAKIDALLAKAGTDKSKLLSAVIYITDMANFADMNKVWDGWVSPGNTPARATVQAQLAAPPYKVEIMVVAAK